MLQVCVPKTNAATTPIKRSMTIYYVQGRSQDDMYIYIYNESPKSLRTVTGRSTVISIELKRCTYGYTPSFSLNVTGVNEVERIVCSEFQRGWPFARANTRRFPRNSLGKVADSICNITARMWVLVGSVIWFPKFIVLL